MHPYVWVAEERHVDLAGSHSIPFGARTTRLPFASRQKSWPAAHLSAVAGPSDRLRLRQCPPSSPSVFFRVGGGYDDNHVDAEVHGGGARPLTCLGKTASKTKKTQKKQKEQKEHERDD